MQEMLQDVHKEIRMKSVSHNSGVVDKGSAGHIFTLTMTVLALCSHHLEIYRNNFFLSYQKNWNFSSERYVALLCSCITTLRGILLHYCIPLNLLECIMQICDRSLHISKKDLGNARAAAELRRQSEQSSTATVCPLRAGYGEHRGWAAGLSLATQNSPSLSCSYQ